MQPVIKAENISKRYRIGGAEKKYDTFGAQMMGMLAAPLRNLRDLKKLRSFKDEDETTFWALRDINFEVQEGEVLGIIGHNGAGKSTLLKILSRITEPTTGEITIHGRVSSLLEVGTGFHPDLSGRDNIYMNGTILGMRKREIDRKLDEIIEFSGITKHIDTPVKRYSSGMTVRLAFSVAAHLEPEILIIDEVLAVGDAEFQKKCLGKMKEVSGQGRTVLFVSHNLAAIKNLCTNSLVINKGEISFNGPLTKGIDLYLSNNQTKIRSTHYKREVVSNYAFELLEALIQDQDGKEKGLFDIEEEIIIRLSLAKNAHVPNIKGYFVIKNKAEEVFVESDSFDFLPNILEELPLGIHNLELRIPKRVLPNGHFIVYMNFTSASILDGVELDSPKEILAFDISDSFTRRGLDRKAYTNCIVKWENMLENA